MSLTGLVIPLLIGFVLVYGLVNGVDVFAEFVDGAKEGISTAVKILPALVALMTCVGMFKASGGLSLIGYAIKPITEFFNIPPEVVPLGLIRPISGSGALALYTDILENGGASTTAARVASVLMGSSETTFYTIALYFGACKINKTRHTVAAALSADFVSFVMSAMLINILF